MTLNVFILFYKPLILCDTLTPEDFWFFCRFSFQTIITESHAQTEEAGELCVCDKQGLSKSNSHAAVMMLLLCCCAGNMKNMKYTSPNKESQDAAVTDRQFVTLILHFLHKFI